MQNRLKMLIFCKSVRFASLLVILACSLGFAAAQDIIGCGGFVKSEVEINFSLIEVKLYTPQGSLKYQTECAPNNGYYMIPVYDRGDYVLKVAPPPGWTFEPESYDLHIDGQNDPCSRTEDVNFKFTGFGVVGKVVSRGSDLGPAGVTLTLKKTSGEVVKVTDSVDGGDFTFEKVLPGQYTVTGSHPNWKFDKNNSPVVVGRETGNVGSSVTILGYNVRGQVFGEGEPVRDVMFLLFSDTVLYKDVSGCEPFPMEALPKEVPAEPLCYTRSNQKGDFVFPALPCGKYSLVPFYQGDLIMFDVVPARMDFTVNHDSVVLKEPFQVAGFSVSGRVMTARGGKGVPNAKVTVNGKFVTKTTKDGGYTLDGVRTGKYSIDVAADDMTFDTTQIKISPNTPQLEVIFVAKFSVCGQVIIDKLPDGLTHLSKQRKVTVRVKGQVQEVSTILTEEDGRFCTMLKPGDYVLKVVLSDTEIRAGLKLSPAERDVKVKDSAVRDVKFSQFRAQVIGQIKCLESCGPLQLSLAAIGRHEERQTVQSQTFTDGSRFTFHNVMPGKYKVMLLKDEWCWQRNSLEVSVFDKDVNTLEFVQSGYILSCSLSHDIKLNFAQEQKAGNVGSFDLTKGVNKFCLSLPGRYKLEPVSCHKFERDVYDYDTSSPHILTLTAVAHRVEGSITTDTRQEDIYITVRTSSDKDAPVTIGPLVADQKLPTPEPVAENPTKDDKNTDSKETKTAAEKPKPKKPVEDKGPFTYQFKHWAKGGEKFTIVPSSKTLLFYPPSIPVTVSTDTCPGHVAKFDGKKGVFIVGQIKPALSDVQITITPRAEGKDVIEMVTDAKGAYTVGPLHSDIEYDIRAQKAGYVLTVGDNKGHFNAFKLGEVTVQVLGDSEEPLGGVLLSLTGVDAYRSNNLTHANGTMSFGSLSPGQYYLRPMMKEFSFDPASRMVEVTEGSSLTITIKGNRVAFSCYGSVTSLNGEPEPEVYVEALGEGDGLCKLLQEEAKTEQDGSFRIRGLQPKCDYTIRLKSGDINQHIERAAPKARNVKVVDADITNIHIIAFRRLNQLDISGNVITSADHLPSIKVHLYKETNMDSPIHTTTMGATSFFYLPALKIDGEEYVLRLESSLSKAAYDHSPSEVSFRANSTYRHFTFKFDPKRKTIDQELNQGSIIALPLTLLALYIAYNHKKVLPLLLQNLSAIKTLATAPSSSSRGGSPAPSSPTTLGRDLPGSGGLEIHMVQKQKQKLRKA